MNNARPAQSIIVRLEFVDFLRGIALIAMTLFHFGWDLELFGIAERGFASQPAMVWFARCIASSFLFLVGFSLVLAHNAHFKARPFLIRLAKVAVAAILITIATYIYTPHMFIFFGILHHIALASVLGLALLRLPAIALVMLSALFLIGGLYAQNSFFNAPIWWWSGLNEVRPLSSDYVPIFPFFSAVLLGMAAAKYFIRSELKTRAENWRFEGTVSSLMKFIGRHSLVYYLLHQPIMIGFLYVFQAVIG